VLRIILALVTTPVLRSIVTKQTPLPVMCLERASAGYWGRGAYNASAFSAVSADAVATVNMATAMDVIVFDIFIVSFRLFVYLPCCRQS